MSPYTDGTNNSNSIRVHWFSSDFYIQIDSFTFTEMKVRRKLSKKG